MFSMQSMPRLYIYSEDQQGQQSVRGLCQQLAGSLELLAAVT
jgi:hypothetical protein